MKRNSINLMKRTMRFAGCGLVGLLLAGCAGNPILKWNPPNQSAADLSSAHRMAQEARSTLQEAVRANVAATQGLSNGLIGLGGVIAGLAAGHAHRDAIVGGALLGGTAYTIGSYNSSAARLTVYQAGIDAINCAEKAVAPFDAVEKSREAIDNAVSALVAALAPTREALTALNTAIGQVEKDANAAEPVKRAKKVAAATKKSIEQGEQAVKLGRALLVRIDQAPRALINAVVDIQCALDKQVLATVPDLTSIRTAISGLAASAGMFAPGAGVDGSLSESLAAYAAASGGVGDGKGTSQPSAYKGEPTNGTVDVMSASKNLLEAAIIRVASVVPTLTSARVNLASHLAAFPETSFDSLDKCKDEVKSAGPLTTVPKTISFAGKKAESSTLLVRGGVPPYVLQIQESPADGVTLTQPAPFESVARVSVNDTIAGKTFHILVMDSSRARAAETVEIKVGAGD